VAADIVTVAADIVTVAADNTVTVATDNTVTVATDKSLWLQIIRHCGSRQTLWQRITDTVAAERHGGRG
jgi:hypothetical protein